MIFPEGTRSKNGCLQKGLAGVGLLTLNDLTTSLNNADKRPLLAALTCIVGNFALPGIDTLGEALVKYPAGGMIAVWAPSGLSVNEKAVLLNLY